MLCMFALRLFACVCLHANSHLCTIIVMQSVFQLLYSARILQFCILLYPYPMHILLVCSSLLSIQAIGETRSAV